MVDTCGSDVFLKGMECWAQKICFTRMIYCFKQNRSLWMSMKEALIIYSEKTKSWSNRGRREGGKQTTRSFNHRHWPQQLPDTYARAVYFLLPAYKFLLFIMAQVMRNKRKILNRSWFWRVTLKEQSHVRMMEDISGCRLWQWSEWETSSYLVETMTSLEFWW